MKCPYCSSDLVSGFVFAPSSHALYWLPNGQELGSSIISPNNIKKAGGLVLGEISKVGFFSTQRPETLYCNKCKVLITKI